MKKLLIVLFLLSVCAALEVPEDYQCAPNASRLAALNRHGGSEGIHTNMPEDIKLSEQMLPL